MIMRGFCNEAVLSWPHVAGQDLKGAGQQEGYEYGAREGRVPLSLDEFEDAGGLVSFDSSQLLPSQEGLGEEEGDAAARRRGGRSSVCRCSQAGRDHSERRRERA